MKAIFRGRINRSGAITFRNKQDYDSYCEQHPDMDVLVKIEPMVTETDKLQLFAFYQSVILPLTVRALTDDGWAGISEAFADKYLKNALAKKVVYNSKTGQEDFELPEKKAMSKAELTKLITDSIYLLRERHNVEVPDSESYLENKKSGFKRNFKRIK